jgi:exodeoxyribonuclease V gamma subunit
MGFDLMAAEPRPGDPSPRDEGRRLFDEAVLSARDRLIITYGGRSIRNDAERPPSVVVSELLEQVEAASGADVRRRVVVHHALHAFSPRYFRGDDERLFSHDAALCDAARSLQGPRQEPPAFVRASLPEADESLATRVSLDELCAYFASPTAAFVSRRVGVRLGEDVEPLADREPLALGGLDRFAVETEILERARTRKRVSVMPAAIAASGQMPLGTIGAVTYDDIHAQPAQMGVLVRETLGTLPPPPRDVDIVIADGARLIGWLRSIGERGQIVYRYARPRAKHHLDAWIRHLAMLASGVKLETHVFARGEDAPTRFRYLDVPDPVALLADLVGLYRLGQRVPLPLFPSASMAYAEARRAGKEHDVALRAAHRAFDDDYDGALSNYVKKVYAERDPLDPAFRLVEDAQVPPFDVLAERVFSPLLLHRTEVS